MKTITINTTPILNPLMSRQSALYLGFKNLLSEERAQGEWNSVYLLIVFAIAAILIIALIKPMFKQSQDIVNQQPVVAEKK